MALYSKSPKDALLAAFNAANPNAIKPLTLKNAIFGKPVAITPVISGGPNTQVTLRGRQGQGYAGKQTFLYSRLSLSDLFYGVVPAITAPGVTTLHAALANINGRYGLNLTTDDLTNVSIPAANGALSVRAKSTSLQYTGSTIFRYFPGKLVLDELINDRVLATLSHPIDLDGRLSAKMLAYGLDFSDYAVQLRSIVEGSLSIGDNLSQGYASGLVDTMVSLGFPSWDYTGAHFAILKTADVPDAKQYYDSVAVITNITDNTISGDMYLHFNEF